MAHGVHERAGVCTSAVRAKRSGQPAVLSRSTTCPRTRTCRAGSSTLSQALDVAEQLPADRVGVVVDTFHVWWDPQLAAQVRRAGPRIASYQVCDWITPLPADTLLARG